MVFEHIEKLKRDFTDQYVVVDDRLPELKRFAGWTGQVKTVNMSGRALVEFSKLENIGWYDIDVDFLKIVDEPAPEEESKTPAKAAAKPAAKKAADAKPGAMSVADVLAAARGGAAPAAKAEPKAAAPAAKKMSVEDMLAAARGEKSAAAAAAPAPAVPTPTPAPVETPTPPPAAPAPTAATDLPTNPADIVAWCRQRDGA